MDTKLKGDIAEQAAILQGLKRGWGVLKPVGDRLPYDLVFDVFRRNLPGAMLQTTVIFWTTGGRRRTGGE